MRCVLVSVLAIVTTACPVHLSVRAGDASWSSETLRDAIVTELKQPVELVGATPLATPTCDQLDINVEAAIVTVTFRGMRGTQLQRVLTRGPSDLSDTVRLAANLARSQLSSTLPDLSQSKTPTPPPAPPLVEPPSDTGLLLELSPGVNIAQRSAFTLGATLTAAWSFGIFQAGLTAGYRVSMISSSTTEWPLVADFSATASYDRVRIGGGVSTGIDLVSGRSSLVGWQADWIIRLRTHVIVRLTRLLELPIALFADLAPANANLPLAALGLQLGLRVWLWK